MYHSLSKSQPAVALSDTQEYKYSRVVETHTTTTQEFNLNG